MKEIKYGKCTALPARVGMMSLVGVGDKRPCEWGNYFSFAGSIEELVNDAAIRCLNFWAENLETCRELFLKDSLVQVILYEQKSYADKFAKRWAIIDDVRIPKEWYCNALCTTGGNTPPIYILKEIYDYLGDPDNRMEEYLDPMAYWRKKGGEWYPSGIVKYPIKAESRQLKTGWTCETSMDAGIVYTPSMPKHTFSNK